MARLSIYPSGYAALCLALAIWAGCATSHHPVGEDLADLAGQGPTDMPEGTLSLTPNPITVVTSGDQQTAALTVTAAGSRVQSGVTFTLGDPSAGSVSGEVLTIHAGLTRGEQTTLTASYGGHSVTVPLIITLIAPDVATTDLAGSTPSAFFGGSSGGPQPAWLYPFDGSMMPPNYGTITLQWSGPPGVTPVVQRLLMQCLTYQQTVYVGASACATVNGATQCQYTPARAQWLNLTYSCAGSAVGLTVTTSPGIGMMVSSDGPITVNISPQDLTGAMYYLNYVNSTSTAIYRAPAGADQPVLYIKNGNTYGCAGCHSLSRDGSMVAAGFNAQYQAGGEPLGLVNGKNGGTYLIRPPGLGGPGTYDFSAFSPKGDMLLVNAQGNLSVLDTVHGSTLYTAAVSGRLAQPDWSPDGQTLALVQTAAALANDYELDTTGSSIVIMPFNSGSFGLATPIVGPSAGKECNFYPAFSPDSKWIIFNSTAVAAGQTCNVHNSTNTLLQIVSAQFGATPVILNNALHAMNSAAKFARFVPFPQNNGKLLFFTFSSQVQDGFREPFNVNGPTSQIWMAAIDLDKLQNQPGVDPSYAPFWVPGQSLTSSNYAAQWTANVACLSANDCPANYTCTSGTCVSLLQ